MTKPKTKSTPEKETPEPSVKEAVEPVVRTPEESAIHRRIAGEAPDWGTITEEEMEDFSLMEDPLKLPIPAQERQDRGEYAFRWAERTPERIDQLRNAVPPLRWWICNNTTTPFLKDLVDPVVGGVLCLDQILFVKPWRMHVLCQGAKNDLADNNDRSGNIETKDGEEHSSGSEWLAGKKHKISSRDVVVVDEAQIDSMAGEVEDSSELGDLIVND